MAIRIVLDGQSIDCEDAFHARLREVSGVPWYGGNLDALFDLLVGVVPTPLSLIWNDASTSRVSIGPRFDRIIGVIFDAIAERGRDAISFTLES